MCLIPWGLDSCNLLTFGGLAATTGGEQFNANNATTCLASAGVCQDDDGQVNGLSVLVGCASSPTAGVRDGSCVKGQG